MTETQAVAQADSSSPSQGPMMAMLVGGLSARMRKLVAFYWSAELLWRKGRSMYRTAQAKLSYTVQVEGTDPLYPDIHAWLLTLLPPDRQRALIVQSGDSSTVAVAEDSDSPTKRTSTPPLRLLFHGESTQEVMLDGHTIKVTVVSERGWERRMEYRVTFNCHGVEARDALIAHLSELSLARRGAGRLPRLNIARWGDWYARNDLARRPVESVVLRAGQMENLIADLALFRTREADYLRLGVPYHRGYLFHGPPGTGKTSAARALATHFGMDLHLLQLNDVESDTQLTQLVNRVPAGSMLLIEDVDTFAVARDRNEAGSHATGSTIVSAGSTLSGLLNALDGMATPHGLVTVMTTNDKSVIDDALMRQFRVNVTEDIGYLDGDQLHRLLRYFLEPALRDVKPDVLRGLPWPVALSANIDLTAAEVLGVIMANLDDPYGALDSIARMAVGR